MAMAQQCNMFYIFKATRFNITNLPQYCLLLGRHDLYGPCRPFLNQGRLDLDIGTFASNMCPTDPRNLFRHTDWTTKIELLTQLDRAQKNIVWAVYQETQLQYLKDQFGDNALTISTTWDNNELVLEWLAKFHVKMQDVGVFEITDNDKIVRSQNINLIQHYINAFDSMKLVPDVSTPCADYNIPIADYFNQQKFFSHLERIGTDLTTDVVQFYKNWIASNL